MKYQVEINDNGDEFWYKNGKLHREGDKPAVIGAAGTQYWYKNGVKLTEPESYISADVS